MKEKTKKHFGLHRRNLLLILSAMFILFGVCLSAYVTADAAGGTQIGVTSWDALKAALEDNTDSDIVITKALGDQKGHKDWKAELMVYGHHTLDLNGHDIDVSWGDDDGEDFGEQYLFYINTGASLTVNDSSGDNSGMIRAHAYITTATAHITDMHTEWTAQNEGNFNDFYVADGASLVINGGEIVAGRHKSQWITNVHDKGTDYGEHYGSSIGASYTGYADQVQCGSCIHAGEGSSILINGGSFYCRSSRDPQYFADTMFFLYGKTGKFVINGGEFQSITGTNIFRGTVAAGWDVKINAGYFKCDYLNRVWTTDETTTHTFLNNKDFQLISADTAHGYSGVFNIKSSWLPKTPSGQLACDIDYDGVICSDTASFNQCMKENTDGREIRTLTITPKNGTSAGIKAVDSSFHQYVGKEGTIRFEDQDFYFADMDFEGEIGAYLGNCGPSIKLTCFVTYVIQEWEDGKYNGSVSFSKMADGVQLGPKQGLSLSKYQKWASAGGIKWKDGNKKGENAVLVPNNRYEVYALFKYYMSNNGEFTYQIVRSELPFGFIYENGIAVEKAEIGYEGLNVVNEYAAGKTRKYVAPGVKLSDAVLTSRIPEVTGIRVLNVLENGKYVGEDAVLEENATYEIYLEFTAAEGYALNQYTQVQFAFDTEFKPCVVSKDNRTLEGWIKFRTACAHEYKKDDASTHTCTKCKETRVHDYGRIKRIDANTEQRTCATCGYVDVIEAQQVGYLTMEAPKVLAAGDAIPDLAGSFDDLKNDGVITSFSAAWYYYGTEEPASDMTMTAIEKLGSVNAGTAAKEGYYILVTRTQLTQGYRFGALHGVLLPTVGSTDLKLNGSREILSEDRKTLICAESVKAVPQLNVSMTLPNVKCGMNFAQFTKDLMSGLKMDKAIADYSVVVTAYPDEEKVTDALGTAIYVGTTGSWEYKNGSLFTGSAVTAKDTFVFADGEAYDIRILFTPLDETSDSMEIAVNPVITGANEANLVYEQWMYGGTVKAVYVMDKTIRMVEVNADTLKMGDDVNANLDIKVSDNVNVMQTGWLAWNEATGDYEETTGKAECGKLYRKTVVLTTDNHYDAYEFAKDVKVLLNNVSLKVDGEYSITAECCYYTSSRLAVFIYSDYRHELEFVKTEQEASCTKDGVDVYHCIKCGQNVKHVTEAVGHQLMELASREATCVSVGTGANYSYCIACEKYFNADGTAADEKNVFLPVNPDRHEVSEQYFEYRVSENGHRLVCPSCTKGSGAEEPHHFEAVTDNAGNVVFGLYACDTCGYTYGDMPDVEKFTVYTQPVDVTALQGQIAKFFFMTTAESAAYQWQYRNAGTTTWKNMTVASATAATLEFIVSTDTAWDGRQFRCIATDKDGAKLTSETVTLKVDDAFKITQNPTAVTVVEGDTAVFNVTVLGNGLTYQWKKSTDGGKTWVNSSSTGAKTATLSIPVKKSYDGWMFRCEIKDKNGRVLTSQSAKLTAKAGPAKITVQPKDTSVMTGSLATIKVTATGEGLTYVWKKSTDSGKTWVNSSSTGCKTDTLSMTVKDSYNGMLFKCVVKDAAGNIVESNAVKLTVTPAVPVIVSQPQDVIANAGAAVAFTVKANGTGLTYVWKKSTDSGKTWVNSSSTGCKTDTLSMTVKDSFNGMLFKCVITDQNGKMVTSQEAKLTVVSAQAPDKSVQPVSQSVKAGETVFFKASAGVSGYTYQWLKSIDGGKTWVNSSSTGAKTETLSMTVKESYNGYLFKCKMTKDGKSTYSDIAKLTVNTSAAFAITNQPVNAAVASGGTAVFKVTAAGEGLSYQWKKSTDGGKTWVNSSSTGAKTATLSMVTKASYNGLQFKCVVTDKNGQTITSNAAALTIK